MISEVAVGDRVVRVPKILCVARNYADHAKEMGTPVPQEPIFFLKPTTALLPGGGTILLPPESKRVEVETELAVILKAGGRDVSAAKAMDLVGGYAVFFDITARDLQAKAREEGGPWTAAKGFDTFAPISKGVVAHRGIDPHGLSIRLRVNGVVRQDSNTSQLIFHADEVIAYLSQIFTLEPGDLIFTGTPPGVGMARKPPVWLKPGDVVEV